MARQTMSVWDRVPGKLTRVVVSTAGSSDSRNERRRGGPINSGCDAIGHPYGKTSRHGILCRVVPGLPCGSSRFITHPSLILVHEASGRSSIQRAGPTYHVSQKQRERAPRALSSWLHRSMTKSGCRWHRSYLPSKLRGSSARPERQVTSNAILVGGEAVPA